MSDREKKLGAMVGLLVVLWGGNWAWQSYSAWQESASRKLNGSNVELEKTRLLIAKARYRIEQLDQWKDRSLPAQVNVAQSLYRGWLIDQLEAANLYVGDVTRRTASRTNAYDPVVYQVGATGKLESLVNFLDKFYRSDQLHKISSLSFLPKPGSNDLTVTLAVDALVVEGTKREAELSSGTSERLELNSVDEYLSRIVGRNPFVAYRKPVPTRKERPTVVKKEEPRRPPSRPRFNHAEHASITGLVSVGNDFQAWVWAKTMDNVRLRLDPGDEVEIGLFKGVVVDVTESELLIETENGLEIFHLGDTLTDGELVESS